MLEKVKTLPLLYNMVGRYTNNILTGEEGTDSVGVGNCDIVSDVYLQDRFAKETMAEMPEEWEKTYAQV